MSQNWPTWNQLKRVHIIGVCGTLMGNFAAFLKRRGIEVTGSDQNIYPPMSDVLAGAGVKVFSPYSAENLSKLGWLPDLIVIGNVISRSNPEADAAMKLGVPFASLPETMERLLLPNTRNRVVCGTHGKTTTSSLLAFVLRELGQNPSYFFGGVAHDFADSFFVSDLNPGSSFVLEGDEYDTAFWDKVPKFNHYLPDDVILTSVEYDHADIYPDYSALFKAFEGLIDRIRVPGGRLIACIDYDSVRQLTDRARQRGIEVITYGSKTSVKSECDFWVASAERGVQGLQKSGEEFKFESQLPGMHNGLNATAVWVLAQKAGFTSDKVAQAIQKFRGVKRRQEVVAEVGGVTVIDDFAHHPTAVRETLNALKLKYPGRRIVAVFEPRSATSRRKVFQKDYAEAFSKSSDRCFIAKPFDQSKIVEAEQFSSEQLITDIGKKASLFEEVETGVLDVSRELRQGDVAVIMSNGGFGGFISKLVSTLKSSK